MILWYLLLSDLDIGGGGGTSTFCKARISKSNGKCHEGRICCVLPICLKHVEMTSFQNLVCFFCSGNLERFLKPYPPRINIKEYGFFGNRGSWGFFRTYSSEHGLQIAVLLEFRLPAPMRFIWLLPRRPWVCTHNKVTVRSDLPKIANSWWMLAQSPEYRRMCLELHSQQHQTHLDTEGRRLRYRLSDWVWERVSRVADFGVVLQERNSGRICLEHWRLNWQNSQLSIITCFFWTNQYE